MLFNIGLQATALKYGAMQIRRPRGVTVTQLMVVTAVGFLGGVYIWKPLITKWKNDNSPKEQESTLSSDAGKQIQAAVAKSVR